VFSGVLQVFQMHLSSISSAFRLMLHVLHLYVSKVDRVLHLSPRFLPLPSVFPPPPGTGWASAAPSPSFLMLVTFGAARETDCKLERPAVHPDVCVLQPSEPEKTAENEFTQLHLVVPITLRMNKKFDKRIHYSEKKNSNMLLASNPSGNWN
jgi:hypothetical protein